MTELNQKYQEMDKKLALLYYRLRSGECFEDELFLPTDEQMEKLWKRWQELEREVDALPAPDAVFTMMKGHFQDFCDTLSYELNDAEMTPERGLLGFRQHFQRYVINDRREDEVRLGAMLLRMEQMTAAEDTWRELFFLRKNPAQGAALARNLGRARLELLEEPQYLAGYFPTFTEEARQKVTEAINRLAAMMGRLAEQLGLGTASDADLLRDDLSVTVRMEPEAYRTLLKKQLGVSLEELLAWQDEEMNRTRAEVFEIAAALDIPDPPHTMQEVSDVLFRYAGPCDSAEEMYERAEKYLTRTRAVAHEYVTLPQDENCLCVPLPVCFKDGYPWGGYEGGDFRVRPFIGYMFLNQYNYQNITDGWIKLNALHEAYPGHHVQYVRAAVDTTPETVKIGAKLIPLLEGTCLRTERAFTDTYPEDPFFPLFVAFRRHHTAVRIYVDLMLYYYGVTLEQAIEIYQRELGFDRVTARKQVQAHQTSPGYFTCYYYGMKKLCQWEQEYGFSKKEYTELLFSAGYVSLDTFHAYIRLTPEERERYHREFFSLLRSEQQASLLRSPATLRTQSN